MAVMVTETIAMVTPDSDLRAAIVAALTPIFGAALPTRDALLRLGIRLTPAAICRRRKRGALPVREVRVGRQYYVTVLAIAELMVHGVVLAPVVERPRSKRGRPRKIAGAGGAA